MSFYIYFYKRDPIWSLRARANGQFWPDDQINDTGPLEFCIEIPESVVSHIQIRGVYSSHFAEKVPAKNIAIIDVFLKSSMEIHEKCLKYPGTLAFIDVFSEKFP